MVPNLVVAKVGADGKVSLYNHGGSVDLVADVQGWFPTDTTPPTPPGPPVATSWKIAPSSVLLDPGESQVVSLLGRHTDGTTFDAAPAATVDIETSGSGVTVAYLGDNRIRLTGGPVAGSVNYSATPVGASFAGPRQRLGGDVAAGCHRARR